MRSSSDWTLAVLLLVSAYVAFVLGLKWLFYKLPRKYLWLAAITFLIFLMIMHFLLPTRNPALRSSNQIRTVILVAVLGPLVALQMWRHRSRGPTFTEWAKNHGFTPPSVSRTDAEETLPESLRRLPLFRRGWEPETQYLLERNEGIRGLQTIIFEYVTSLRTLIPWWLPVRSPRRVLRVTVIAFRQDKLRLPAFELRPADIALQPLNDDPPWTLSRLSRQPRFAEQYTLYAQDSDQIQCLFSPALVNTLEPDSAWCLEGLGKWFIAYRYFRAKGFWSLRASTFDCCVNPDELSAWLRTAHHLFGLMTAGL